MICELCNNFFPTSIVIEGKRHILNSRKYCFDCSPFKKHNTRKMFVNEYGSLEIIRHNEKNNQIDLNNIECQRCKKTYSYERNRGDTFTHCSSCATTIGRNKFKKQCLDYKGGKCIKCGYDKYQGALTFHHRDPKEKDFDISDSVRVSIDTAKKELDKCDLLCYNCHIEEHFLIRQTNKVNYIDIKGLCNFCGKNIGNKKGKKMCKVCVVNHRRFEIKKKAIDYKGGCCKKCGYIKCLDALIFHHIDPKTKSFGIGGAHSRKWKVIKDELDKCSLLCQNCHSEEHWEINKEKYFKVLLGAY